MTRMYLSPTASTFAKIGLIFVECLIGLFNLITYPIRKITFKTYGAMLLLAGALYAISLYFGLEVNLTLLVGFFALFTASIFLFRAIHKFLSKKVSPRVALLINSPLGIPRNKYYNAAY